MTEDQPPPTAPGFTGLPLAQLPDDRTATPLRRSSSVRRWAVATVAVLVLAGSGGAVVNAGLAGLHDGHGAEGATAPADGAQTGRSAGHVRVDRTGETQQPTESEAE